MKAHAILTTGSVALVLGAICAATVASTAFAKRDNYSLVPPPPPTPVLQVPPPPVMLPYSAAMEGAGSPQSYVMLAPQPVPEVAVIRHPKPPQPQPCPLPTGVRPANAPNLSTAYARARGFGAPRDVYSGNDGPGAVEAFPAINAPAINTWFDASLRWYANHINAQHFYSELVQQPENGVRNTGYAVTSGMFDDVLPNYAARVYASTPTRTSAAAHRSHYRHSSRHYGHRVVAYR